MVSRPLQGGSGALLMIDLDGSKTINDRLGTPPAIGAGQSRATDLQCVRAEHFVARVGGDEFAVVLGRISARGNNVGAEVSASIGHAVLERGGDSDGLIREADRNGYAATRPVAYARRGADEGQSKFRDACLDRCSQLVDEQCPSSEGPKSGSP